MFEKVFVDVIALFSEGKIYPKSIIWIDGRKYDIDKIINIRKAPALNVGGLGTRYNCRIRNKVINIWFENNKWFLEVEK